MICQKLNWKEHRKVCLKRKGPATPSPPSSTKKFIMTGTIDDKRGTTAELHLTQELTPSQFSSMAGDPNNSADFVNDIIHNLDTQDEMLALAPFKCYKWKHNKCFCDEPVFKIMIRGDNSIFWSEKEVKKMKGGAYKDGDTLMCHPTLIVPSCKSHITMNLQNMDMLAKTMNEKLGMDSVTGQAKNGLDVSIDPINNPNSI